MGAETGISWCDSTWNPIRGCSRISAGCGGANHEGGCYAEKIAARFSAPGQPYHGFAERTPHGGRWTGKVAVVENALDLPLRWKKPRRIFVNSMSDLFHEDLSFEDIDRVFAVMASARRHTFQILTKRADRMRSYVLRLARSIVPIEKAARAMGYTFKYDEESLLPWPIPNVWLGVSVEDQAAADQRIPFLLDTPAAVHFLSCEPLLGPIDFSKVRGFNLVNLSLHYWWVIVGGESGPRSREFRLRWGFQIREQCARAGVPFFMKQIGANAWDDLSYIGSTPRFLTLDRAGADPAEWPKVLQVQEFPR